MIGCVADVGSQVTFFVHCHGRPFSSTGGGPSDVTVPAPCTTMLLVSTESSGGAIVTVLATGNVTGGASPCAQSQAAKGIHLDRPDKYT
jgi:hypothetical protein